MADEMCQVPKGLVELAAHIANVYGNGRVSDELRACLPWEPPAEQVEALRKASGWTAGDATRDIAVLRLRRLHEQGWKLVKEEG